MAHRISGSAKRTLAAPPDRAECQGWGRITAMAFAILSPVQLTRTSLKKRPSVSSGALASPDAPVATCTTCLWGTIGAWRAALVLLEESELDSSEKSITHHQKRSLSTSEHSGMSMAATMRNCPTTANSVVRRISLEHVRVRVSSLLSNAAAVL